MESIPPHLRYEANLGRAWELPAGTSRTQVADCFRALVARHESLRTVYRHSVPTGSSRQPSVEQHVRVELEELPTEYVSVDDEVLRSQPDLVGERRARTFDPGEEPAWRAVVQESGDGPARVLFIGHHITVDGWALDLLSREFALLLKDGEDGLPSEVLQPRVLAAEQRSDAWATRRRVATHYRQQLFDALSAEDLHKLPVSAGKGGKRTIGTYELPLHTEHFTSLCEQLQVTRQSLLLACWGVALNRVLGVRCSAINLVAANRTSPALRTLLSSTTQIVPLLIRTDPAQPFTEYVRQLHGRGLRAYSSALYDVDDYARQRAETAKRHELPDVRFSCGFNFRADEPQSPAPAQVRWEGHFQWEKPKDAGPVLLTDVRLGDVLRMVSVCDPRVLADEQVEHLTRSFAATVRSVWEDPTTVLGRLGAAD